LKKKIEGGADGRSGGCGCSISHENGDVLICINAQILTQHILKS